MKRHAVRFHPNASADIDELYVWIAGQASRSIASGYIKRIRAFCNQLRHFPNRGQACDDIRAGLRFVSFEGRVSVAFEVSNDRVIIIRVLYAGRQFDSR